MATIKYKQLPILVTVEMAESLKQLTKKYQISRSELIRRLIQQQINLEQNGFSLGDKEV
jgi:metal-responsive CopG/Arc/MetJ family transcriptional regulator